MTALDPFLTTIRFVTTIFVRMYTEDHYAFLKIDLTNGISSYLLIPHKCKSRNYLKKKKRNGQTKPFLAVTL